MKRLLFSLSLLLAAVSAFGQGAFIPPQTAFRVVNGLTSPIANATITVCGAAASGIPCAPVTVSIFSDVALTQPLSNPFTADSSGNYQFAVALGTYTVTVTSAGFNGYSYQVSVGGAVVSTINGAASPGVGLPARVMYLYGDSSGVFQTGTNNAPVRTGAQTGATPTATEAPGVVETSSASASTNVVAAIGHNQGAGLNGSNYSFGTIARYTVRFAPGQTTNARFWIGLGDVNGPGDYSNTVYASDAPPRFYCMFRYSVTTDTHWKAICATDASHQTIVDTGITPVTTPSTLFEIVPNAAMTAVVFYINGSAVANITTNLPLNTNQPAAMWTADNKNTANVVSGTFYWSQTLYSK